MKAKFIYEENNFERGIDPKTSLRIGGLKKTMDYDTEKRWQYKNLDFVATAHKLNFDEKGRTYVWILKSFDHITDSWNLVQSELSLPELEPEIRRYISSHLNEYHNFERGQDTIKSSLNIGIYPLIKKFIWALKENQGIFGFNFSKPHYLNYELLIIKYNPAFFRDEDDNLDVKKWFYEVLGEKGFDAIFSKYNNDLDSWRTSLTVRKEIIPLFKKAWEEYKKEINESQNFERGINPKESIGIGVNRKIDFNSTEEIAKFILDNIEVITKGKYKPDTIKLINFPEQDKKIIHRKVANSILPWIIKYPSINGREFIRSDERLDIFNYLDEMVSDKKEITESQNFERGISPKQALEIGIFSERKFTSYNDFFSFIVNNFWKIIGEENKGKDVIGIDDDTNYYMTEKAGDDLNNYIEKYIKLNGETPDIRYSTLYAGLLSRGELQ